jgi:hypothetical protein
MAVLNGNSLIGCMNIAWTQRRVKMTLKIGDKVKVVRCLTPTQYIGSVGVIERIVENTNYPFMVKIIDGSIDLSVGFAAEELKKES